MDKVEHYRSLIKQILTDLAQYRPAHGEIEPMVVFDEVRDHYQLVYTGWDKHRRIHMIIVHVRLHNDKFWIEFDGTADGIALDLEAVGVPRTDIVLAFHSPKKREYGDYAVA